MFEYGIFTCVCDTRGPNKLIISVAYQYVCCHLLQNRAEGRLFSACKDGDLETVKRLSKVVNVKSVQDGTLFSQSPLHYCCR